MMRHTHKIHPDDQYIIREIGTRLRYLRQARGESLAAVSERAGVSPMTLSSFERGENIPTLPLVTALCRANGTTLWDIVLCEREES